MPLNSLSACEPLVPFPNSFGKAAAVCRGRHAGDAIAVTLQARGEAVKQARTISSFAPYWTRNKIMRWHQTAKPDDVFAMMVRPSDVCRA
jgi:hypothetical protein